MPGPVSDLFFESSESRNWWFQVFEGNSESKNHLFQELQNHETTTGFHKNPQKKNRWFSGGQLFDIFTKYENLFEKSHCRKPLVSGIWGKKGNQNQRITSSRYFKTLKETLGFMKKLTKKYYTNSPTGLGAAFLFSFFFFFQFCDVAQVANHNHP